MTQKVIQAYVRKQLLSNHKEKMRLGLLSQTVDGEGSDDSQHWLISLCHKFKKIYVTDVQLYGLKNILE